MSLARGRRATSVTAGLTACPVIELDARSSGSRTITFASDTVSVPPDGIASRALTARFTST